MTADDEKQAIAAPFASFAEMRTEHANLMRAVRKEGRSADTIRRVGAFLQRAQATGKLVDGESDRDSAQGVLDYWTAWRFSSADREALSATPLVLADFDPSNVPDLTTAEEPYLGLRAFGEADAGRFTGREEAIRSLLEKLRRHPIVFVTGPLGSGKSSLVFAGIVPRLRSRAVLETQREPIFPVVLPGADPLVALLKAVHQSTTAKLPDQDTWVAEQKRKLERSPASLREAIQSAAPGGSVVMIVDQFEEVFTLCTDQRARDQFAQAITSIAEDSQSPHRAILIVREDYAQPAYNMEAFKQLAGDPDTRFSPPTLTSAELIRVIASAADAVGLKFDKGIVEDLAQEVAGDPASLPTLQFTLSALWARRQGNRITRDVYSEVGRPRVALARAAESAFNVLAPEEQKIAEQIFLELVEPAIGNNVLRRRIRRDTLIERTGNKPAHVNTVLERFVGAGLVRKTKGTDSDDDRFEVAHEALVNNWKRLDAWLKAKRQDSEKKLQLITTAKLWQEAGHSDGYLLSGDAIKEALPYREAAPELRDLVAASEKAAQSQRTKRLLVITIIPTAFLGLIAFVAFLLWQGERLRREHAELAREESELLNIRLNSALLDATDATQLQQKRIDDLEARLRRVGLVVPSDEAVPRAVAQVYINEKGSTAPSSSPAQQGWVWIGSDPSTNLQDQQTAAPVLPQEAKPGGHYRILKNVVLRKDKPTDTYSQAESLGVVPDGTPITALGPAIPYERPSGRQYWLSVRVDPSDKPVVYYQFANATRPEAQQFADALQARGYRIPAVQALDTAKGLNEVRYFYAADRPAAEKLAGEVTKALRDRGANLPPTKVADLTSRPLARKHPGVLELWLDMPNLR